MEKKDKRKITDDELSKTRILTTYSKGFPTIQLTTDNVAFYVMSLSMVTAAELSLAMQNIILSKKEFPSVSEIIETVENIRRAILDTYILEADEAWSEVIKEINRAYPYKDPIFSTREIAQTVRCIGYLNLCTSDFGSFYWQFKDVYNSILKRKKEGKYTKFVLNKLSPDKLKLLQSKMEDNA